jgi:5'-nucleotidase
VRILISNDDGVYADGIWALAGELKRVAEVIIVAPDRGQSAAGTTVSLRKQLRVQPIVPLIPNIQAYSVEGTPCDSVIIGLDKIVPVKIDLVVSGINQGPNLGADVLISGTVGAALTAYLRGFPAIAVSASENRWNVPYLQEVARFITLLAEHMQTAKLPGTPLLNVNFPDLDIADIKGVKVTGLAHHSPVNSLEEGHDGKSGVFALFNALLWVNSVEEKHNGKRTYYLLNHEEMSEPADEKSDIGGAIQGYITIAPLNSFLNDRLPTGELENLVSGLMEQFKTGRAA